jgi:hypothetical protein
MEVKHNRAPAPSAHSHNLSAVSHQPQAVGRLPPCRIFFKLHAESR